MATVKGVGLLFGLGTGSALSLTITGGSALVAKYQAIDYEKSAERAELRDEAGSELGRVYYNAMKKLTIQCVPYDSTSISTASTNAAALLPAIGTSVTLVDNQLVNETDVTFTTGLYVVENAKAARTNTSICLITLELECVVDNDISVTRT